MANLVDVRRLRDVRQNAGATNGAGHKARAALQARAKKSEAVAECYYRKEEEKILQFAVSLPPEREPMRPVECYGFGTHRFYYRGHHGPQKPKHKNHRRKGGRCVPAKYGSTGPMYLGTF